MTTMNKFLKYSLLFATISGVATGLFSCKDFLNPEQELNITEDKLFNDYYEYRAVCMGLYGLQQQLVEQLVVLGELRGDLLQITENANADLVEVYNFNISKNNKYASPLNFYKLISASNNFIRMLKKEHPEVMDPDKDVSNYDRLYGEALCMRAWAYFNAVRIYKEIPFFPESLTSVDEITNYVNSSGIYIDSVDIRFSIDGYDNDTTNNTKVPLEKQYLDQRKVIDLFTRQLETEVKAVGVNHYIENNDNTWEVTIWNEFARHALLGQMYLTDGNYVKAVEHFGNGIIYFFPSSDPRYQLDRSFSEYNWRNILDRIDLDEHILTIWFNKANLQQNSFQELFEPDNPHKYMLKPTRACVLKWENLWDNYTILENINFPALTRLGNMGRPGDFYRGHGVSYAYVRDQQVLSDQTIQNMLYLRALGDERTSRLLVEDADTVVWKYSYGKKLYDQDANFIVYRAAGIHLYMAEIYTWWAFNLGGTVRTFTTNALNILNDGSNYTISINRPQLGVRGRVGFGGTTDGINLTNYIYNHDPYTNKILGYIDLTGNLLKKQLYLEEQILEERARELAFEGERYYDLMRIAQRRKNIDPDFLARTVSAKYPQGQREVIYNHLLNEDNWYIRYFE